MADEQYPGLEFSPPEGTIGDEMEGEALVKWKKVGDRYTIVEFEGQPLEVAAVEVEGATPESISAELTAMDEGGM